MHATLQSADCEALLQRLLCRCVNLHPASNQKIPGIFLQRVTRGSSKLKVKFAVKLIDRLNRDKSIDHGKAVILQLVGSKTPYCAHDRREHSLSNITIPCAQHLEVIRRILSRKETYNDDSAEFERSFEGETSWGWPVPENMEQTSPALIKGDKLVLRTHVWLMKVQAYFYMHAQLSAL